MVDTSVETVKEGSGRGQSGRNEGDPRAMATRAALRRAFLELKAEVPLGSMTVSEICRRAGVSRGAFYLHYGSVDELLDDVLDEALSGIGDMFSNVEGGGCDCKHPLCMFIRSRTDYRCVFADRSLTDRIYDRIYREFYEGFRDRMMRTTELNGSQIRSLFCFQINGCLTTAILNIDSDDRGWCAMRSVLDEFIIEGMDGFCQGRGRGSGGCRDEDA